ncbi:glycosyltransferase family 8 protein [Roseobacter weihaiensis]|uniref:glycosyltransferase family 8 protein n=1 Tax=Roseobacter weihaiensis TaxID=2763262 RepID=UPI001D0A2601|nr:glycosyltransferase family 8 protein [Roseobacter sp. H9]
MADIPIILCFDDRILIGAGVTIKSLVTAAKETTTYEINIFNPGFDAVLKADLLTLVEGTRHSMRFFEIPAARFEGVPKGRGSWTEIVYYRLLASEVLADRDKAIYSDVDVYVTDDLGDAFATDLSDIEWAGVAAETNTPEKILHYYFPENTKDQIVFSGFMVMNLSLMRDRKVIRRYFDTIEQIGDRLRFFDLDLLNIATPQIGTLPLRYVVLEDLYEAEDVRQAADYRYLTTVYSDQEMEAARDDPAIIHYAGPRGKPWQRQHTAAYYRDVEESLPRGLRVFNFRNFRKKWLSRKGYRKHSIRARE